MKPKHMILRCYAEKKGDIWQAFCIDLNLAVQSETKREVRLKLHQQISSYLYDALEGEDKQFADQLLRRKAPIKFRLKYYYIAFYVKLHLAKDGVKQIFNEIMPLTLQNV